MITGVLSHAMCRMQQKKAPPHRKAERGYPKNRYYLDQYLDSQRFLFLKFKDKVTSWAPPL